ncbi:MAG: hypothetical protein D6729_06875, partial [Deltaproteobacteria bacterium]
MRRALWSLLVFSLAACGRGPLPQPRLVAIEPDSGRNSASTFVTLTGENLLPGITFDLGEGRGEVPEGSLSGQVGNLPLASVAWVDAATVTAVVPPGLAPGRHDVSLVLPTGETVHLAAAFEATDGVPPAITVDEAETDRFAAPGLRLQLVATVEDDSGALGSVAFEACVVVAGGCEVFHSVPDGGAGQSPRTVRFDADAPMDLVEGDRVRLTVRAADPEGNQTTASWELVTRLAPSLDAIAPSAGGEAGGTRVVVSGAGFDGDTRFFLGGAPAAATVVDGSTAWLLTPPGMGKVDLVARRGRAEATLPKAFTYFPGPAISMLSPPSVSAEGGRALTITGTGLTPDPVVHLDAQALPLVSAGTTRLVVMVPPATPGDHLLTVETRFGATSLPLPVNGPPQVVSIEPPGAPEAGGTLLVLHGSGFVDDPSTRVWVGDAPAPATTVLDTERIEFTAPPGVGTVPVQVRSDRHPPSAILPLTYRPAPHLYGVTPTDGPLSGGTTITVRGAGFVPGAQTAVLVGGVPATAVTVPDPWHLTAVTPQASTPGAVPIEVAGPQLGQSTGAVTFRYNPTPRVTGVRPPRIPSGRSTRVEVVGVDLLDDGGTTVTFNGVPGTDLAFLGPDRLEVLAPPLGDGIVSVEVRNPRHDPSNPVGTLEYTSGLVLTAVEPGDGPLSGGQSVLVRGGGFPDGATFDLRFGGVSAPSVVRLDEATLQAQTPPGGLAGPVDVQLVVPGVGSATSSAAYRYNAVPRVDAVVPPSGLVAGGAWVEVRGANFLTDGATSVYFGSTPAPFVEVRSEDTLLAEVPPGAAGPVAVEVRHPRHDPSEPDGTFTYGDGSVVFLAPSTGRTAAPGEPVPVHVLAQTSGAAVASVTVTMTPPAGSPTVQTAGGGPSPVGASFDFVVPAGLPDGARIRFAATAVDTGGTSYDAEPVEVEVRAVAQPVALEVAPVSARLTVGEARALRVLRRLSDGTVEAIAPQTDLVYQSSGAEVLVTADGVIRGEAAGHARVTVSDGSGLTAACEVTVEAGPQARLLPERVLLSVGGQLPLRFELREGAQVTDLTGDPGTLWTSSDPTVVAVGPTGVLDATGVGEATVTATALTGETASATVRVVDGSEALVLDGEAWAASGDLALAALTLRPGTTLWGVGSACFRLEVGSGGLTLEPGAVLDASGGAGGPGAAGGEGFGPSLIDAGAGGAGGPGAGGGGAGSEGGVPGPVAA